MSHNSKEPNKTRYISTRHRLLFLTSVLIIFIIVMFWLFNTLFMSYAYRREKLEGMENVYAQLEDASLNGIIYDGVYEKDLEQLSYNHNVDIVVLSYDGSVIITSGREKRNTNRLLDAYFSNQDKDKIMVHTSTYDIKMYEDEYIDEEFLVLTGTLSDGNIILVKYAMANMRRLIEVFDESMIIVAVIAFVFAFLLVEVYASILTRPIVELTEISKKMSELDFGVKYRPRKIKTEVDILGEHVNSMSDSLEDTYVKLQKANAELAKDIELRDENAKMRSDFLAAVSHELKTPIAIIQGYAEGLNEGMADDPEDREYYTNVIIDEADKMNKIVGRLLALDDLEYGIGEFDSSRFNLVDLIRGIVDAHKNLIEQNDITIEYDIEEDIYVDSVDDLIEMTFTNYLTNAIHYCEGDKIVKIALIDKDDMICVTVFNTGDAIPEDAIPRLFDRFYKVDKARSREYGGSGIGLSIVKTAMNLINGKCGVYNSKNGVTFWFEIYK